MLGRRNKVEPVRRSQPQSDASFDMATYRRGTTLNSFKSDEPTQSERRRLMRLRSLRRRIAAILAVIIVLLVLGISVLSQFTGSICVVVATNDDVKLAESDIERRRTLLNDLVLLDAIRHCCNLSKSRLLRFRMSESYRLA